ncbi:hypothetical protein PMO31116_03325 [Pandoraea morbifera]|uniref:Uncharacterized protein n=1 Tax=Pandoraea morbifera TaxID=2508300 RepID=A0A5E4WLT2_9BURK|nr:hypothetical protein PMO31116_03325 [Pandoraea morbifera]
MTERQRPTVMLDMQGGMAAAVPLFYPSPQGEFQRSGS